MAATSLLKKRKKKRKEERGKREKTRRKKKKKPLYLPFSNSRNTSSSYIRFWYLRCCGCPGLRGRQHLATPHTRSP